ncbi:MAG: hypothetical protein M0Q02_13150 [Candidatus Muirbacterium halophilum]|nr:hypothetical protein [Candidatus Muirbacterium halophilum]
MSKKIFYLLIFVVISTIVVYSQEIGRFILIDEKSDFSYKLQKISKNDNGKLTASLYNKENNITYEVLEGDNIPGFNLTDVEINHMKKIVFEDEKQKLLKNINKELLEFSQKNNILIPNMNDVGVESAIDSTEPSKEEVQKMLNFVRVKEIGNNYVLLEDIYRNGFWKLIKTSHDSMSIVSETLNNSLKVPKSGDFIILDAIKDSSYGDELKVGNYKISACHDNEFIYFYTEYFIDEPVIKSDELFTLKFNSEKQKHFYDAIFSDKYLMIVFLLMEESKFNDIISKKIESMEFDIWDWEYPIRKARYLFDMKGVFTAKRKNLPDNSDINEIEIKNANSNIKYFYIYPDEGNPIIEDSIVSPETYLGDIFVPGTPSLKASGSNIDVMSKVKFNDDESSAYLTGKITLEFKRKLNTGYSDDVRINKAVRYIFKPVDYREMDSLDFSKSVILKFID